MKPAPKLPLLPSPVFDTDLVYWGTWRGRQRESTVRLIDRGLAQQLRRRSGRASLSDFAVSLPGDAGLDPSDPAVGLRFGPTFDEAAVQEVFDKSKVVSIESEARQWTKIEAMFRSAKESAAANNSRPEMAQEYVAYMVLDVIDARLYLTDPTPAQTTNFHATISLGAVHGRPYHATLPPGMPGADAAKRVIGNIHTHYLYDPLINTKSTSLGTKSTATKRVYRAGVSEVDLGSAADKHLVVYAVDSKYLHRAVQDHPAENGLARQGNVLRDALMAFGRLPRKSGNGASAS